MRDQDDKTQETNGNGPASQPAHAPEPHASTDTTQASPQASTGGKAAAEEPEAAGGDSHGRDRRSIWLVRAAGLLVPILILFPKLGAGGIWDPHELTVADFARRVAVHVWSAQALTIPDAENSLPTLEALGKGELPFTSIGLGFATFGLHEWAGRLPLALWALAGVLATYWMLTRLMDEKTGAYGAIALCTMPTFFVQARTMLGEIVTIAAFAIAVAGLAVAAFDAAGSRRARAGATALAVVGLTAGFMSRGILIGVAVPLLTVGLAWLLMCVSTRATYRDSLRSIVGGTALAGGLGAAAYGAYVLANAQGALAVRMLGTVLTSPAQVPSFDDTLATLGHGLLPWSAFVPFAVGRLFRPAGTLSDRDAAREMGLRAVLVVGTALGFGAFALMAMHAEHFPFAGLALLAGIAAVAIRDLERGAAASRTLAIGVVTFLALFYRDFKMWPEKGLSAFGVTSGTFPDTFKQDATRLVVVAVAICAVLVFASWLERDDPKHKVFDWGEYREALQSMRRIADGNVAFVGIVVEAALIGFGVLFFLGMQLKWKSIVTMSANVRFGALNAWWIVPVASAGIVVLAFLFRDYFRWVFGRQAMRRPFSSSEVASLARSLRAAVRGTNLVIVIAVESLLVVLAVVVAVGLKLSWGPIVGLSDGLRAALANLWWMPLALVAFGVLVRLAGLSRASMTALGACLAAAILSFSYYPALAAQLSPREVFESYAKLGGKGEPLALLGVSSRTASYYARGEVQTFGDVDSALGWLLQGQERRWLVLRDEDLARLNSSYRARTRTGKNLPILDARSSRILLASNQVGADERSRNPLDEIVLAERAQPSRPLDVELEGQLKAIGWDVVDPDGRVVQAVTAGRQYRLRLYYEVTGRVTRDWKSFIHIDGHRRRFNGDHDPMDDKYPMTLWQVGDYMVDDYPFALEPNFTPGEYGLFFGFFVGNTRMKVTRGEHQEDRINGGAVRVQ